MNLAERLKVARESIGKNQKEIADLVGVSYRAWQGYETGENVPGGKIFESLVRLGFSGTWLLTGEGEMKHDGELPASHVISDRSVEVRKTFQKINSVELYRAIVKSVHELNKELDLKWTSKDKILMSLVTYIAFSKEVIPETGKFIIDIDMIKNFIKLLGVMESVVIGPLDSLNLDNMYNILSHIMGLVKANALSDKFNASHNTH